MDERFCVCTVKGVDFLHDKKSGEFYAVGSRKAGNRLIRLLKEVSNEKDRNTSGTSTQG